jgi:hypothetical protein
MKDDLGGWGGYPADFHINMSNNERKNGLKASQLNLPINFVNLENDVNALN